MEPPCQVWLGSIAAVAPTRYNQRVKPDIDEDDLPLLVRALEHYAAYLEATKASGRSLSRPGGRVEEKAATGGGREAGEIS